MRAFRVYYTKVFSTETRVVLAEDEQQVYEILKKESPHILVTNIHEEKIESVRVMDLTLGDFQRFINQRMTRRMK